MASGAKARAERNGAHALGGQGPTNGGSAAIALERPYTAAVTIRGACDLLFHRWNCEAVAARASAAKGSKAKKTDDVESFVYRDEAGRICLPGEYVRGAIVAAAKFQQDPRSPRKSAADLFKAALVVTTQLSPLRGAGGAELLAWDYEHAARVMVQRSGLTRVRPAVRQGWEADLTVAVLLPHYVPAGLLQTVLSDAGKLIGVGDFRPTYGRFHVAAFAVLEPQ